MVFLDLHTDFSGGRSGGLICPCLEEFSIICCYPHSQRFWCSQESRSKCFSGTLLLFFHDTTDVGNLISGSSAFSKSSLNIWKFTVMYCWSLTGRILSITLLTCEMSAIALVWAFFGIAFLWYWNENWPFPVLWAMLRFPVLLAYWVQHFHSIIF